MTKEKIADKIKKLLALSKSDNEHEASLALANANKLLMKHNLEMKDLEEIDLTCIVEEEVMSAGRIMNYKSMMLNAVMGFNNCEILIHSITHGNKIIKAIGKKQNIDVSLSMYEYLMNTMERKMKVEKPRNKTSFRLGFSHSIAIKIKEIMQERNNSNNDVACTALVIQEKKMAKDFMHNKYKNLRTQRAKTSYRDRESFDSGVQAGNSTSLNSQIM
jgi:hypothetical protein